MKPLSAFLVAAFHLLFILHNSNLSPIRESRAPETRDGEEIVAMAQIKTLKSLENLFGYSMNVSDHSNVEISIEFANESSSDNLSLDPIANNLHAVNLSLNNSVSFNDSNKRDEEVTSQNVPLKHFVNDSSKEKGDDVDVVVVSEEASRGADSVDRFNPVDMDNEGSSGDAELIVSLGNEESSISQEKKHDESEENSDEENGFKSLEKISNSYSESNDGVENEEFQASQMSDSEENENDAEDENLKKNLSEIRKLNEEKNFGSIDNISRDLFFPNAQNPMVNEADDLEEKQNSQDEFEMNPTISTDIDYSTAFKVTNQIASTSFETTTTTTTTKTTTSSACSQLNCHIERCNFGRKKDTGDCETCECLKNPNASDVCQTPFCNRPCFYGSFPDENGCDSCLCRPRPKPKNVYKCPKLECDSCNYGSIKDEYGCETCICIRPNSVQPSIACPQEPPCPYGPCKHGSILNDFGCPTCDCLKSQVAYRQVCVRHKCAPCQHGHFTDAEGCETCLCKPAWMQPCGMLELTCETKCEHGFYLDRNGCPSCECLPNPNLRMTCEETLGNDCNNADGTFRAKQCDPIECKCVTKHGIRISDFKANSSQSEVMNCECALTLHEVSTYKLIGFKLFCAPNGNYEQIQCVGSSCACVNEHGDPLGPSVPIYQKHLLRCEGVFQRAYDDYFTTILPPTLTPPLCVYHREKSLETSGADFHMSIPECDEKGLYRALQCDRLKKYCWCVNVHNGVELYGTRRANQTPICS